MIDDPLRQKLRELLAADDEDTRRGEADLRRLRQRDISSEQLVYKTMPAERQPQQPVDIDQKIDRALTRFRALLTPALGQVISTLRREFRDELKKGLAKADTIETAMKYLVDHEFVAIGKEIDGRVLEKAIEELRVEMKLVHEAQTFEASNVRRLRDAG
jgi:hypothetical protein